jgi:hypothetical protein
LGGFFLFSFWVVVFLFNGSPNQKCNRKKDGNQNGTAIGGTFGHASRILDFCYLDLIIATM